MPAAISSTMASMAMRPASAGARAVSVARAAAVIDRRAFVGRRDALVARRAPIPTPSRGLAVARAEAEGASSSTLAVAAPVGALLVSAAVVTFADSTPVLNFINANGVPTITALGLPDFAIRWLHGINMGIVLGAMGGYGTYLGYKVKGGNGSDPTFGTPFDASTLHPLLMAGMTFFFTAGALGGITFEVVEGRDVLSSPHAISALAGLGLLVGQGLLGVTMGPSAERRALHAGLGTSIMALFVVHAGLGLYHGLV